MWTLENPPPPTLMLISFGSVEALFDLEYTILQAVPRQHSSLPTSNHLWVCETLLEDSESQALQENCSESGWVCTQCQHNGQNVEGFITHLKSRDHALNELNEVERPLTRKISKFMQCHSFPEEPSKELNEIDRPRFM